jgi:hypothetical protein
MRSSRLIVAVAVAGFAAVGWTGEALAVPCVGPAFGPSFVGLYTCSTLGLPPGVTPNLGGITFLDDNNLLVGGHANQSNGVIDEIGVVRGVGNHITGFSGVATQFSTAPQIDGGLSFGPGNVLFFTGFPSNTLGEIKSGSTSPDKTVNLSAIAPPVASSVGSLGFVPPGFAGAGGFKILSFNGQGWYDATLTSDGSGTYNVSATLVNLPGGGPEGIAYVSGANPGFVGNSVLIDQFSNGRVEAYTIDSNGDPVLGSAQVFLSGLSGAEGAVIDPLTGDFLFSTFGGGNQVVVVSGFQVPVVPSTPEPGSVALLLVGGLFVLGLLRAKSEAKGGLTH